MNGTLEQKLQNKRVHCHVFASRKKKVPSDCELYSLRGFSPTTVAGINLYWKDLSSSMLTLFMLLGSLSSLRSVDSTCELGVSRVVYPTCLNFRLAEDLVDLVGLLSRGSPCSPDLRHPLR